VRKPVVPALVGAALLTGYALAVFHHTSYAAGGADSSGYLNASRLFASGRASEPIRGLERLSLPPSDAPLFIPLGYGPGPRPGTMSPSYPPGLPLHMALAAAVGGTSRAPFLVSPIAGLACLVLIFFLGRELGLPRGLAGAGSVLLGFTPVFVFMEVAAMSDVPATAWALAAVLAAFRARRSMGWSALAGVAFAVGVLVRPMNALLLPALLLALPARPKSWGLFVLGGSPFAAFLLIYDAAAFGSPLRTGYGGLLAGALAWGNFPARAAHYAVWLSRTVSPLLPLGWIALAFDRRVARRDRAVLFAWFAAFYLFYSFYAVYETWWYTRFLLPAIPALVLGTLLVLRDVLGLGEHSIGQRRALRVGAAVVLLLVAFGFEYRFLEKERPHKVYKGERVYPDACEMARRRLPDNAIVASMQMSGALHYYTDRTYVMWNMLDAARLAELRAKTESRGYRWYALLVPFEQVEVSKNLPGSWREIDRTGDAALWELAPDAPPAVRPR
jgi:dolichyl-phosphate-mannose-protein mannosyltransferase